MRKIEIIEMEQQFTENQDDIVILRQEKVQIIDGEEKMEESKQENSQLEDRTKLHDQTNIEVKQSNGMFVLPNIVLNNQKRIVIMIIVNIAWAIIIAILYFIHR